jgi:hypothetical protein
MKKALLLPALAAMLFFSCKKDHSASTSPSGKKYRVTFNVSNFTAAQSSFAVRHGGNSLASDTITNLSGYLDVLYYQVSDNSGNAVGPPIMQDSTMSNMGIITDSLPEGNYGIAVAAGKKGLIVTPYDDGQGDYYFSYGGGPNWLDTFWGRTGFTVSSGPISQSLTLNRSVSEVELKILDDIPATADSLFMTVYPEAYGVVLNNGPDPAFLGNFVSGTASLSVAIPASAKGKTNYTTDLLVGPTMNDFTVIVSIVCKDAAGRVLGSASLGVGPSENEEVVLRNNQKTVISGDLFTGLAPSQSFSVQVDTAWNNTPLQKGFGLRKNTFKAVTTR